MGHKKYKLEKFSDNEINGNVDFELENCPYCNGELTKTGEICKDELSYRFVPIKRRNHFRDAQKPPESFKRRKSIWKWNSSGCLVASKWRKCIYE